MIDNKFETRKEVEEYLSGNTITCLICGEERKRLGGTHLRKGHGLSPDEYKIMFGIPLSYTLEIPSLLVMRVEVGKRVYQMNKEALDAGRAMPKSKSRVDRNRGIKTSLIHKKSLSERVMKMNKSENHISNNRGKLGMTNCAKCGIQIEVALNAIHMSCFCPACRIASRRAIGAKIRAKRSIIRAESWLTKALPGYPTQPFVTFDELEAWHKTGDYITCLECGEKHKSLTGHIVHHGITAKQFKLKYNIPNSYGLLSECSTILASESHKVLVDDPNVEQRKLNLAIGRQKYQARGGFKDFYNTIHPLLIDKHLERIRTCGSIAADAKRIVIPFDVLESAYQYFQDHSGLEVEEKYGYGIDTFNRAFKEYGWSPKGTAWAAAKQSEKQKNDVVNRQRMYMLAGRLRGKEKPIEEVAKCLLGALGITKKEVREDPSLLEFGKRHVELKRTIKLKRGY